MKIQNRILLLMLGGICLSFVIFSGITFLAHSTIQDSTVQLVKDFSRTTANELWQGSENQGKDTLLRLAASQAHQADDLIVNVSHDVEVLSKSMTRICQHPEYYSERSIADPLYENIRSGQVYILYSNEDIARDRALRHEIGIASSIQDEMADIALTYKPHRVSLYAASEHGYFITVDIMPDDGLSDEMDGTHIFEARERTWYLAAKEAGKLVFSDVYMDYVTGKPCITCGAPYYDADGFAGVLGFGMYLDVWHDVLMDPSVNPYPCFVLTDKGEVVVSSHEAGDLTVSTGNDIRKALSGSMAQAATEMVEQKSGVLYVEVNGQPYYLAFAPMKTIGWSLGILTPVDVVFTQADDIRGTFLGMLDEFKNNVDASYHHVNLFLALALLAVLVIFLLLSHVLAKQFVRPIQELTAGVQDIAKGNLDKKIEIHTGDELELLGESFNSMTQELQEHILRLTSITAEKERIATELNVASEIQFSMLPNDFSLGAGRFDIFASMTPAKSVGGDFYDFYMLGEDYLAVVIADVSGKGIPAALFMAAAKNCLKHYLLGMDSPEELEKYVMQANVRLCENNDKNFFVTLFLGVLDLRSGLLRFVNAGHTPPLLRRQQDGNVFRPMRMKRNFALGVLEDWQYAREEIQLAEGDVMFLYTDGVTEAENEAHQMYSMKRLAEFMNGEAPDRAGSMQELLSIVRAELGGFVGHAEQSDDITMLALTYGNGKKIKIPYNTEKNI